MKLQNLLVLCMFGAVMCSHHIAAESEPEPPTDCMEGPPPRPTLTTEEITQAIYRLRVKVNAISAALKRMQGIGRATIGRLDTLITRTGKSNTCLSLDIFGRPAAVHVSPERDLVTDNTPQTTAEMSVKVHALKDKVERIGRALHRFKEIGKANIGTFNRFVEEAKKGVCGASYFSPCPAGFVHFGTSCYQEVIGILKPWEKAQEICHKHGAHLVSIESREENDFVLSLLQFLSPAGHRVWIGLNRHETAQWTWVHSHEETSFDNFKTCRAADDDEKKCTYMCMFSHKWLTANCEDTDKRFICERAENTRADGGDDK